MNNELMLDVGQANELKLAFRREGDWTNQKIKALTERRGLLNQVLDVLENRAKIVPFQGEYEKSGKLGQTKIIPIDRTRAFDPVDLLGNGWSIWKGPADGSGLHGEEEQDECSLTLKELNVGRLLLVTGLKKGESSTTGEERLIRLRKMKVVIRLDAAIFLAFWKNQQQIHESWKEKTDSGTTLIFFDGTILRGLDGSRCSLYLYWGGVRWLWDCRWFGGVRYADNPSVCLQA